MSTDTTRPLLYVITGLSGSGKSVALKTLEDLDVHCTDNLPVELLPEFVKSVAGDGRNMARMAVGIDVRGQTDLSQLSHWREDALAAGLDAQLLFFDARDPRQLRRAQALMAGQPGGNDLEALMSALASSWPPDQPTAGLQYDGSSLTVIAILCIVTFLLIREHANAQESATRSATTIAQLIDADVLRTVELYDLTLQGLIAAAQRALAEKSNQYPPMRGLPELREGIHVAG